MILTVTVNPMVEVFMECPGFKAGGDFRPSDTPRSIATGKPLNVSRALHDLGQETMALVALGGAAGRQIEELLEEERLPTRVVALRRESRRGVSIFDHEGQVTTIYGPSPKLCDNEVEAVLAAARCLSPARFTVVGGAVSRDDLFARVGEIGGALVVDASGPALLAAMDGPEVFLAKPNLREARATFGVETALEALDVLSELGARNVIVTDEDRDAWFRIGSTTLRATPPRVSVRHSVGCGDALCAGFLFAKGRPPKDVVAFAVACGAYAATHDGVGGLDRHEVDMLAAQVAVEIVT